MVLYHFSGLNTSAIFREEAAAFVVAGVLSRTFVDLINLCQDYTLINVLAIVPTHFVNTKRYANL